MRRLCFSLLIFLSFLILSTSLSIGDSIEYLYDDSGRLIKVTNPETNMRVLYQYDEVGNLISISSETSVAQSLPPTLEGIDPDILLIGTNNYVTITGHNLLTTNSVASDNPNIIIKDIAAINTRINATLSIASAATSGQSVLTVTTSNGSTNIPVNLYGVNVTPPAISIFTTGSSNSGDVSASLIPSAPHDFRAAIKNNNPDIISLQPTVIMPGGGSANFTIHALKQGTGIIEIGNAQTPVYVLEGGNISLMTSPVCVTIDTIPAGLLIGSASNPVSVQWLSISNAIVISAPVCIQISN